MKNTFLKFFHLYKMKDILSKQFACLRNGKQAFEAFFVFTKWKHVFYLETLFISKKRTLQKHVRSFIGISFCNCKKQLKNVLFYFVSLRTGYKTCFWFLSKRKTLQNFYDSFCKSKERFKNMCFNFKNEIWFKSMVYEVSVEIISEKNKNNFVVAQFFLSRMCFLKMSKTRIWKFCLFTRRFESGCSQI